MTTTQTAFRLPEDLIARVDGYADHMTRRLHISLTRTDAVIMLLQAGLKLADAENDSTRQLSLPGTKSARKKTNVKR